MSTYYVADTLLISCNPSYSFYPFFTNEEICSERLSTQDYQEFNSRAFLTSMPMVSFAWQPYRATMTYHLYQSHLEDERPITDNSKGERKPEGWVQDCEGRIIRLEKRRVGTNNRHCISAQLSFHSNT